jgi:(p)ppGpp synthase/HD superfamily hydrolase
MSDLEMLEKAIALAVEAHRSQKDRYGAPYILHPLRVMARVHTPLEKTVAVLHDMVEDTDWTFDKLRQEGFDPAVIEALDCLTKRSGEEYMDFVRRSAQNPLARCIKLADLEDNMDLRRVPASSKPDPARWERYLAAWRSLLTEEQP